MSDQEIYVQVVGDIEQAEDILDQTKAAAQQAEDALEAVENKEQEILDLPPLLEVQNKGTILGDKAKSFNFTGTGVSVSKDESFNYVVSIPGSGGEADTPEEIRDKLQSLQAGDRLNTLYIDENNDRRFISSDDNDKLDKAVITNSSSPAENSIALWGDSKDIKAGPFIGNDADGVVQLDGQARLPAVDGSQLTGIDLNLVDRGGFGITSGQVYDLEAGKYYVTGFLPTQGMPSIPSTQGILLVLDQFSVDSGKYLRFDTGTDSYSNSFIGGDGGWAGWIDLVDSGNAVSGIENSLSGFFLSTKVTLEDGKEIDSTPVEIPGVTLVNVDQPAGVSNEIVLDKTLVASAEQEGSLDLKINAAHYPFVFKPSSDQVSIEGMDDCGFDYRFNGESTEQSVVVVGDDFEDGATFVVSVRPNPDVGASQLPVRVRFMSSLQERDWYVVTPTQFIKYYGEWHVNSADQMIHINDAGDERKLIRAIKDSPSGDISFDIDSTGVATIKSNSADPGDGFTLRLDSVIKGTNNDEDISEILGFTGGGSFQVGPADSSADTFINVKDDAYIRSSGDTFSKIIVEGKAGDPREGFVLNQGSSIEVSKDDGSTHTAIDVSSTNNMRLGSPSIPLELRTSEERVSVQVGGSYEDLAYTSDIQAAIDPGDGFKLKTSKAISSDDPDGNPTEIIVGGGIDSSGFPQSLLIGSRKLGLTLFTEGNGAYVEHDGGTGKILLEGEASGIIDRGTIDELKTPFTDLEEGKYYIDFWEDGSELPDLEDADRVGILTVFGGYYGEANGAYWHLASHRWGLYINIKSAGVLTGWKKVLTSDSYANFNTILGSDGSEYLQVNRETPVVASGDTQNLQIVRIIGSYGDMPSVEVATLGQLASGFSLCPGGATSGDEIIQIASGKYTLSELSLSDSSFVYSGDLKYIYLELDGTLTTTETGYRVGWLVSDGVVIDIDLYNSSINTSTDLDVETITVGTVQSPADEKGSIDLSSYGGVEFNSGQLFSFNVDGSQAMTILGSNVDVKGSEITGVGKPTTSSAAVNLESLEEKIEDNNDSVLTPVPGDEFLLIDTEKSTGYGKNGSVTYFAPQPGRLSPVILQHLDYGKSFAVHEEVNSIKMILILHESLVSEIYGRDLTGVNSVEMLFTGNAKGRLGKSNQSAGSEFIINWNGDLIPKDNDPNEENPTQWVAADDSVTETWSSNVRNVCYSKGSLNNRGSASLRRGDATYQNSPEYGERCEILYDNSSEFFVMPIICGGGTFNVIKIFQMFMTRNEQYVENWGAKRFDSSADCIGTILKIAYDAAIVEEEESEIEQNDQLLEGLASGFLYAKQTKVG